MNVEQNPSIARMEEITNELSRPLHKKDSMIDRIEKLTKKLEEIANER